MKLKLQLHSFLLQLCSATADPAAVTTPPSTLPATAKASPSISSRSLLPSPHEATTDAESPSSSSSDNSRHTHRYSSSSWIQTLPSISSPSTTHHDLRLLPIPLLSLHVPTPSLHVTSLAVSGSLLLAATAHHISAYNPTLPSPFASLNSDGQSSGSVKSIAFSGSRLLTAHQDGKIRVWNLRPITSSSGPSPHHNRPNHINYRKPIATLPTMIDRLRCLASSSSYDEVRRHKRRLWNEHNDAVSCLAVTCNGALIYSVSWDKTMKVWRSSDFRCLRSVVAHDDAVNAVVVSKEGVVFTGSADKRIRVWARVYAGEGREKKSAKKKHVLIATLEGHESGVNALALSSDGATLFSGSCDRSILVWERVVDGENYMAVTGVMRGHEKAVLCLVNVSDFLVSGSADRTVRVWGRGDGGGQFCCLTVLVGHSRPVKSVAAAWWGDGEEEVEEEGFSVFSGSLDGEIKVWRVKVLKNEEGGI